jgi:hypothetical protein
MNPALTRKTDGVARAPLSAKAINPTEVATLIDELEGEVNNGGFDRFYDLDDEFYAYPDNLSELLKKYNSR